MEKESPTCWQCRSVEELQQLSLAMSKQIIEITTLAASGHPSSSLSAIDILTCLYLRPILRYNPTHPHWPLRDRFILSKGHAAPGLYAALARAGFFSEDLLQSLRENGSPLEGHPNMRLVPGLESSTGSLGQGLSIGIGHALAAKMDRANYNVYVMIGDGELQEGQVWEAAMFAASHDLDNLTAIVDHNAYQQTGAVGDIMPALYPLPAKWRALGWFVREIDGHNIPAILDAFEEPSHAPGMPKLIVAHTHKGKRLSAFEEDAQSRMHGMPLKEDQVSAALAELHEQYDNEA